MPSKSFLSGLEELLARVVSLVLTLLFFVIYALSNSQSLTLDWFQLAVHLSIFWIVYETLALIFFQTFLFFSTKSVDKEVLPPIPSTDSEPSLIEPEVKEL